MRKTHKKTSRNKHKTHKKMSRNKRKTSTYRTRYRQGGVGTRGQAAALQQVFNTVNRPYAQNEIAEILAHQSYRDMEESIRREARIKAKDMARTAIREHGREHKTRKAAIKLTGPSQATLTALREKGTQKASDNQRAYENAYSQRDKARRIIEANRQAALARVASSVRLSAWLDDLLQRQFPTPFDRFER